jgi:endonuclease/exonuclease/phosphatase family metal-dependent hydrolase
MRTCTPRVNRLLVRTWNLFHGNAKPPERRAFLEQMVRLISSDAPDVVCLQEVPAWALPHLDEWSAMAAVGDVAARPMVGPIPSAPEVGRVLTDLNHGLLRSAFTGQANAILLAPAFRLVEHRMLVLNPFSFRRRVARRLSLGGVTRLAWGKERRVCQVLRVSADGSTAVVANLHATSYPDKRLADSELARAAAFVDAFADPAEPVVFGGDFNLTLRNSHTLRALTGTEWGFDGASATGIDHILTRVVRATPIAHWPEARRRIDGRLLSDHAPAERTTR